MLRRALVTVGLLACGSPPPVGLPAKSAADAGGPEVAVPAPIDAGVVTMTADVDAGPPPPPVRAAATEATLVFRRFMIGALPYPGARETWTIERYQHNEIVVRLRIDESSGSIRTTGVEREPATWTNIGEVVWSGTAVDLHVASTLRLESKQGVWGTRAKRVAPGALALKCKTMDLAVLAGTAKLVPGDACGNGGRKPAWSPAGKTRTKVERCTFGEVDEDESDTGGWDGLPSFAKEPGVEWVFENSDCSAQEGAYRLIAPPKT